MKLMSRLAYSQLKTNRSRSIWTLLGIALATAMITAVFGFAASGMDMFADIVGDSPYYLGLYKSSLSAVSAVFVSIIVAASVIVVSNAFRVSAGERTMQFGILKSTGATKRQIAKTILYEGLFLCVAGIPAGIALGLIVNYLGIEIINYFLASLNRLNEENPIVLHFVFAWQAIALGAVVSLLTVLLSAWLPARKAAKVPAIEAIRGAGEIKMKSKHVRANPLVKLLFGFEGTLASKSLKRSRRSFRATVVSLTVSVIMLIVVGDFGIMMGRSTDMFFTDSDATAVAVFSTSDFTEYDDDGNLVERRYYPLGSELADEITSKMCEYPDTTIFGVGGDNRTYVASVPKEMMTPKMLDAVNSGEYLPVEDEIELSVGLVVTDEENYERMCTLAGVPVGSNILLNTYTQYIEGGRSVFAPFIFEGQTLNVRDRVNLMYSDVFDIELPLHGVLSAEDIPDEVSTVGGASVLILVPEAETIAYAWYAHASDPAGFAEFAGGVLTNMLPADNELISIDTIDITQMADAQADVGTMIMVFVYGFVGMLTLIGLTNVISTISANVRSRAREFAVLRSVGMTPKGLRLMLSLESILCSSRALLFGVPLGVLGSYLVYNSMNVPVEMSYQIPWVPVIQCVLGVFVITWVTMRFAASRVRRGSIIETIRSEAA